MKVKTGSIILLLLLLTACISTTETTPETVQGNRNQTYQTANFTDLPYSLRYHNDELTYNVSVLAISSFTQPYAQHEIVNNSLIITVINASEDPQVKPSWYTTTVTGTISARKIPSSIQIKNEAGLLNDTITLQ